MTNWQPLKQELAQWRAEGRALPLWWRDDDAVAHTPALDRLHALSVDLGLPVHLAVIPGRLDPDLPAFCRQTTQFIPVVHGWTHKNRAPLLAKNAEFGHPRRTAADELRDGLRIMQDQFGPQLLAMFVPPWNRLYSGFLPELAACGYEMVSTFTPRAQVHAHAGLVQINTHIDPIDWRGSRSAVDADQLVAQTVTLLQDRRAGKTDATEPLGFLSHHLAHDAAIWHVTQAWLSTLLDGGAHPCRLSDQRTP